MRSCGDGGADSRGAREMAWIPITDQHIAAAFEALRERDADLATRKPPVLPAGMRWEKVTVPETSMRAQWARSGEIVGDPLYNWHLYDGDTHVATVKWDERHGWDAYSHVDGSYLPGRLTGLHGAFEEEEWAKRAGEQRAMELRER